MPLFPPITASELLVYAHGHPSVSLVDRRPRVPGLPDGLCVDLTVREARHMSDDEAYSRDRDLWRMVARGNCLFLGPPAPESLEAVFLNSTPSSFALDACHGSALRTVSRGVRKFFDFSIASSPSSGLLEVISTEKANGECARISWDAVLDGWFIGSKNVTLFARDVEDLQHKQYHEQRYAFATLIARTWLQHLRSLKRQQRESVLQAFRTSLAGYTAVAELISSNEHVVYYGAGDRSKLRFFAAVPLDGSETCMYPPQAFDTFNSIGLLTVQYEAVSPEELQNHVRSVFLGDFFAEGEGRVLYLINEQRQVVHICKAKNQIYWILRAIREALKGVFTPEKMAKKLRAKRDFLELSDEQLSHWTSLSTAFGRFCAGRKSVARLFPSMWKEFCAKCPPGLLSGQALTGASELSLALSVSASQAVGEDKTVVLMVGIPGCGKDSLILAMAKVAGGTPLAIWTANQDSQMERDWVVISQDNFSCKREPTVEAFRKALDAPGVRFVFLSRNNFEPRDRETWVDIAMQRTHRCFMMYPTNVFSRNDPETIASFMRCVAHVVARGGHPAKLDSSMDHRKAAFVVASFMKKKAAPSLKECNGLVGYESIDSQALGAMVRDSADVKAALKEIAAVVSYINPFRDNETVTIGPDGRVITSRDKKTRPGCGSQAAAGLVVPQWHLLSRVLDLQPLFPSSLDRQLDDIARDAWARLSALSPVPLYYGLFPDPADEGPRQVRAWLSELRGEERDLAAAGYSEAPLDDMHVTCLYLGKELPDSHAQPETFAMMEKLEELRFAGADANVRFFRLVVCEQVVVAEVTVLPFSSPGAIPVHNRFAHVTLGVRGTVDGRPTAPLHANLLLERLHQHALAAGMQCADGAVIRVGRVGPFEDVVVHCPGPLTGLLELEMTVEGVFA